MKANNRFAIVNQVIHYSLCPYVQNILQILRDMRVFLSFFFSLDEESV